MSWYSKTDMSKTLTLILVLILATLQGSYVDFIVWNVDAGRIMSHIEFLASDACQGRMSGSVGEYIAAEYIVERFRELDLKPFTEAGLKDYYQKFMVENATIPYLKLGEEYILVEQVDGSPAYNVSAPLVYLGYGLKQKGYDPYMGLNIDRYIALMVEGAPGNASVSVEFKVQEAYSHGAIAAIIVNASWQYPYYRYSSAALPIPTVTAGRNLLEALNLSLDLKPPVELNMLSPPSLLFTQAYARNIIGVMRGVIDPDRYVVVSAHYDHLGIVGENLFYYGANDDASGVACILEMARVFREMSWPNLSIIFALYSGEELGLVGSRLFVNLLSSKGLIGRVVANVQLDMVGMGSSGYIQVFRARVSTDTLKKAMDRFVRGVEDIGPQLNIKVLDMGASGASDHQFFGSAGVPAIMIMSGKDFEEHTTYHTPSDTPEHINVEVLRQVCVFTSILVWRLAGEGSAFMVYRPKAMEQGRSTPMIVYVDVATTTILVLLYLVERRVES